MNKDYKLEVSMDQKTQLSNLIGKPASDWIEWLEYNQDMSQHVKMYMKDGYTQYNLSARLRYSIGLI